MHAARSGHYTKLSKTGCTSVVPLCVVTFSDLDCCRLLQHKASSRRLVGQFAGGPPGPAELPG